MSSPLYYTNTWDDVNAYFTMGKGLFGGKVIYRDLFDHKGPLVYFLFGIGSLISNKSFFGVYILEVVSLAVSLYFLHKIVTLYSGSRYSWLSILIYPAFLLNDKIFVHGGSVEEFMVPFLMIGFFCLLRYFKRKVLDFKASVCLGICGAAILMMKFNVAVVFIPLLITAFVRLLLNKQYKNFLWNVCGYIAGLIIVFLPFYVYFLSTNSLYDFYSGYIAFNRLYADMHFSLRTMYILIRTTLCVFNHNYLMSIMISVGLVFFILSDKYFDLLEKISLLMSFALLLCMLFASGRYYSYTYIPITVYIVFGIIMLLDSVSPLTWIKAPHGLVLLCCLIIPVNTNIWWNSRLSHEPVVVKYARIINEEKNPTLLNYHSMDSGVQNIAGLLPNNKYFYVPNISYNVFPAILDEQDAIINSSAVMFVVCRGMDSMDTNTVEALLRNYFVVDSSFEREMQYTLLKRKP
jgi:hypothetical protein